MQTILYNRLTSNQIGPMREGRYIVDGLPGWLPDDVVELKIKSVYPPDFDPNFEYLTDFWQANLDDLTWEQVWSINQFTQQEIALRGWHHPNFNKRIIAPSNLLDDYPAIALHMMINKLPVEPSDDGSRLFLYMKSIKSEHQALVNNLAGALTIENIPS
jgi:hypothetical protein